MVRVREVANCGCGRRPARKQQQAPCDNSAGVPVIQSGCLRVGMSGAQNKKIE